ncbi:MAG: urea transport system ATP-binding protein [Cellvibrionaceae bacterium]|jgi:urea transport system ATP-binding protein
MKSMAGMIPSTTGSIILDDVDLSKMKSFQRVEVGIALVPQGRMIFSTMTVKENIVTGLTTVKDKRAPQILYDLFPVLDEIKSRRGGNLSGGQQQQLAIAHSRVNRKHYC